MAGITNLFRAIQSKTGTFFTFSEVSKQLTKALSNPQITIMPSKFVCLNLPDFKIPADSNIQNPNAYLPNLLQNYFENKITYLQQASRVDDANNSNYFYSLKDIERSFWSTVKMLYPDDFTINFNEQGNNNLSYLQEISNFVTYIGDINIQNYEEYDNMGYSEIFVHIPYDARPIKNILFNANEQEFSELLYKNGYSYKYKNSILGYPEKLPYEQDNITLSNIGIFDKPAAVRTDLKGTETYPEYYIGYNSQKEISYYTGLTIEDTENYLDENVQTLPYNIDTEKDSIDFNAILVYFKIISNNGLNDDLSTDNSIDIPYGLYITSDLESYTKDNITYGHFRSTEHKYINVINEKDSSVYTEQSGSGYVLRIIARYLSVPNGTVYPVIEFVGNDNNEKVSIYSELLGYMQKSQDLMLKSNNYMADIQNEVQAIYEGVKWNQFNVPQIYKQGNNYWWYINFKNTGHRANGLSAYEVYIENLPKDENGNPINPPSINQWLNKIGERNNYTKVLYSNQTVEQGFISQFDEYDEKSETTKKYTFGEKYPDLWELDSYEQPIIGKYKYGIKELIENNELIPGMKYEIVDYKTTQNLGLTEQNIDIPYMPIVVTAASTNKLEVEGYLSENPDWCIYYDYNMNSDKYYWTLSGQNTNKGTIYKLFNKKYNVSFPYDIFNIYFIDKIGNYIRTFEGNSSLNESIKIYDWPSNMTDIHILPFIENEKQYLNNIIINFTGTSDNTVNGLTIGGSTYIFEDENRLSYINYNCPLKNIKIDSYSAGDYILYFNDEDNSKTIYNIHIKSPIININDYNSIEFSNIIDPHFNINILTDKNIYKDVTFGYYYSNDKNFISENILTNEERTVSIRPVLTYISGDGTLQALLPKIDLK